MLNGEPVEVTKVFPSLGMPERSGSRVLLVESLTIPERNELQTVVQLGRNKCGQKFQLPGWKEGIA